MLYKIIPLLVINEFDRIVGISVYYLVRAHSPQLQKREFGDLDMVENVSAYYNWEYFIVILVTAFHLVNHIVKALKIELNWLD